MDSVIKEVVTKMISCTWLHVTSEWQAPKARVCSQRRVQRAWQVYIFPNAHESLDNDLFATNGPDERSSIEKARTV